MDGSSAKRLREEKVDKIIIEARVNELATRKGNPHVPFLPKEIIADSKSVYEEGASVFHYHGRTADGAPDHAPEFYLETNAGIRSHSNILIHPTLGYVANEVACNCAQASIFVEIGDRDTHCPTVD